MAAGLTYPSLFRSENHGHVASLKLRFLLNLPYILQLHGDPIEHFPTQLDVRHLPAAVHHRHLHLVAVLQALARVAGLEREIVIVDPGPVLHFLQMNDVLLLLRRPRRLRLLELELPVIHDLHDGGPGERRDFHQVQAPFLRGRDRFVDRQHPQLVAVVRDHTHRTDADLPVDASARRSAVGNCQVSVSSVRATKKRISLTHPRSASSPPGPLSTSWRGGARRWFHEPCRTLRERRGGWGATRPLTVLCAPSYPSRSGSTRPNALPSFPSRPATTTGSCSKTSSQPSASARRYVRRLLSRVTRGSRSYPMIHGSGRCAEVGTRSARKQARSPALSIRIDVWKGTWPGVGKHRIPGRGSASPSRSAKGTASKLCLK